MSRDLSQDDDRYFGERPAQSDPGSRMTLSQGRGGGSGTKDDAERKPDAGVLSTIRERVERASEGNPTVSEFVDRLETAGVHPIASIQSSGRWNGISYALDGIRVKASHLGRAYTAKGLQQRRGVRYEPARDNERLAQTGADVHPFRSPERPPRTIEARQPDRTSRVRDAAGLNATQRAVLWDVGRLRIVPVHDLEHIRYGGRSGTSQRDIRDLAMKGLIERRTLAVNSAGKTITVLTLTKKGKSLVSRSAGESDRSQAVYSGFVKPREIAHDAALYRMYLAEADRIERAGGHVNRVVLDYELKKQAYSPLAKAHDLPPLEYAQRQREVAEENDLPIVNGHLVLPDLRIEFEDRDGAERHIDLELATRNYRSAHLRSKAGSGFRVYANATSGALASALDRHHLIAEILRS